ncbi:response regulator transcription factor [Clostridium butyricum]|uniref:Stage 0 sporulation protein A homolog n=1 Tax=Clostridium butyricum E4 str. BoNT E BL5262 TaxID=632245 RepID=C4ID00_CLOBU|nr:response regulator transcription factor [Clostridium butyricum]EDT75502.1 DNA-binding response regulator [Clostridium butyricum 5521]EEP55779.1 DNA-binding response regulator TctD [Clostridium butyricum E4 str. BoNT E BL5262]NFL31327.1 response regulator transcription factor [Clostridium butyricum]NFS18352.1 response regulator transcription factor [Clostridium butyricum]
MKLLVVEDEKTLANIIKKGLGKYGYAVDVASDGEEALWYYDINEYDVIILDLNLPKIDGIEVLKQIRQKDSEIKILILSARTQIEDRVLGLDEGANDYLVKPFDFLELEARIRSLIRRKFIQENSMLSCGSIFIDTSKNLVYINGDLLSVTKKEYAILNYLLYNKNTVVSSEKLIEHIWDSEVDLFSNTLKYHMHSLRKKIAEYSEKEIIKTVRGCGYIVEEQDND